MGEVVDGPKPHRVEVNQPFSRVPQCGCDSGGGLTFREQADRIAELEDILALRDAATEALCIAVHGIAKSELTIYHLIHDVAAMKARLG